MKRNCFRVVVNSWSILKSRGEMMLPSIIPSQTLVNYQAVQSWVFIGNFILEDLVMVLKFYRIWDCKSWYLSLEIYDL
jgi:hypothetical protein